MAITLDGITLPRGLYWSDEFQWSQIAQEQSYTITGAQKIRRSQRLAGRPITLTGGQNYCWVLRSVGEMLYALAESAPESMPLILHDARTFDVAFAADPIVMRPLRQTLANPHADTIYVIEYVRLITL